MPRITSYLRGAYERLIAPRLPLAVHDAFQPGAPLPSFLRDAYGRAMLRPLTSLLVAALVLRLLLSPLWAYLPGGYSDEQLWKYWMQYSHDHGVLNIFDAGFVNYIGYQWVLWLLAIVYNLLGGGYEGSPFALHLLVKTPAIAFDLVLVLTVYATTQLLSERYEQLASRRKRLALTAAAVIAFQPALLYDSAVWAQTDSAIACSMLASLVLAARRRFDLAWAALALGFLIKPQPVIMLPVLTVMTFRIGGWRAVLQGAMTALVVLLVTILPWLVHGEGARIASIYRELFSGEYSPLPGDRLSASAWNVWWFIDVASRPSPNDALFGLPLITYRVAGLVLSALAGLLALLYLAPRPRLHDTLIAAAYIAFAFYMLPISTHERYLLPFFAIMLPVVLVDRRWLRLYVLLSATFFLNLVVVAPPIEALAGRWNESPFTLLCASANVALFLWFSAWMLNEATKVVPKGIAVAPERARPPAPARPALQPR
jgi:Gpi18-like mannosyltransferase